MDKIEAFVDDLLQGQGLGHDETTTIVDYSLADQIEELASKGVESQVMADYKPVVKKSVTYIVAAVVLNEKNEILMMQEAKSSCAGTWYLPAGRMEPGEDILEAVQREVLEETGLEFEPTTLLAIENAQGTWYRFVFTGNITGGELKTVAKADAESLQACWIDDLNQLSLRSSDILALIDKAKEYHSQSKSSWHPPLLPALSPHSKLLLRLVVIIRKRSNNRVHVLVSEKESAHLPVCEINPIRSVHTALKRLAQYLFGPDLPPHKPNGILCVEHSGTPANEHDGLCLTMLISCKVALEEVRLSPFLTWLEVYPELEKKLLSRVGKNMTVPLNVR